MKTGMQNSREEPQGFLKTAGRQHGRWEDMPESVTRSIPQFHSRSQTVMWDWTPDALVLTTCSFGMSPLQVPASQFFPDASSPCLPGFLENTCKHPCLEQLLEENQLGVILILHSAVYLLARAALTKHRKPGTLNNRNVLSHQFCNVDCKNAQPQSQELGFIWWTKGRH